MRDKDTQKQGSASLLNRTELAKTGRQMLWLVLGLAVSAVGIVLMLQANVGLEPWSILQQGMAQTFGISYGFASVLAGAAAIGTAVALGESFGVGTISNIVFCAIFIDTLLALGWVPKMHGMVSGILMLLVGLELLALGTWMYLKSGLGAGPRDALMVALARRTKRSVGFCRAAVEVVVIFIGWKLGGQLGVGTVISAVGLGSLFNLNFWLLHFRAEEVHQETLAETLARLRATPSGEAPEKQASGEQDTEEQKSESTQS